MDTYVCFMHTEMEYPVIGDILFTKTDQRAWAKEAIGGVSYNLVRKQ